MTNDDKGYKLPVPGASGIVWCKPYGAYVYCAKETCDACLLTRPTQNTAASVKKAEAARREGNVR